MYEEHIIKLDIEHTCIPMTAENIPETPQVATQNRQFETFAEKILGKDLTSPGTVEGAMGSNLLWFIRFVAIITIVLNTVWMFLDMGTNGSFNMFAPLPLSALLILDAASVYMIVLYFIKPKGDSKLLIWSIFIYYTLFLYLIAAVTINRNMLVEAAGAQSQFIGVYLVVYNIIILCILPMYQRRFSIALGVILFLMLFIPGLPFVPGSTAFNTIETTIMMCAFIVTYILVRAVHLTMHTNAVMLKESGIKLLHASYIDPLTHLLNRRALNEYVEWNRTTSTYKKFGVIIYDIDDFKKFNDTYSHVLGDEVLLRVSRSVLQTAEIEQYVFRYGGEEFIIILPDADDETMIKFGNNINEAVRNAAIKRDDITIGHITITAGCASYSFAVETLKNDIVSAADNQLYIGKRSGKNCTACSNKIYRNGIEVVSISAEKKSAGIKPAAEEKNLALIVDDVEMNREILSDIISEKFQVIEAKDGIEALEMLEKYGGKVALVFLDLVMPRLDGFGVLSYMKEHNLTKKVPVFIISGDTSSEAEMRCLDFGVADFVPKPFNVKLLMMRVSNAIERFGYRDLLENKVVEQMVELNEANTALLRTNESIIEIVGDLVEARSMETGLHVRRIKGFTSTLAHMVMKKYPGYNLTEHKIEIMVSVCALHDVGKIMISDAILNKPGRFTQDEFEIMKTHTVLGCEIIDSARNMWGEEYYKTAYDICRYHHERVDGRGYPDGLKGDEIPISAQIVSIADVYDALVTERVYKKPYSCEQAYNMIMNGECGAFSSVILDCFTECRGEFEELSSTIVAARFSRVNP
ncbi:MAG TPA: diguanylate cyclase [Methanocorpusculum sp.]|nr:diguanylate cyclase [Methanocorpusculum sp.]